MVIAVLACAGGSDFDIVGESFYQDELAKIAGPKTPEGMEEDIEVFLVPESDNEHDPMAVGVRVRELKIGHLSRNDAKEFRKALVENGAQMGHWQGWIVGGWDRGGGGEGHYGVKLDLDWPPFGTVFKF